MAISQPQLVYMHKPNRQIYKGGIPLEGLTGLQYALLVQFLKHPQMRFTKSELILACWPDEYSVEGVSDDSLYQIIRGLRHKLQDKQKSYIVSWRGLPEGGYYFQPAGAPQIMPQVPQFQVQSQAAWAVS